MTAEAEIVGTFNCGSLFLIVVVLQVVTWAAMYAGAYSSWDKLAEVMDGFDTMSYAISVVFVSMIGTVVGILCVGQLVYGSMTGQVIAYPAWNPALVLPGILLAQGLTFLGWYFTHRKLFTKDSAAFSGSDIAIFVLVWIFMAGSALTDIVLLVVMMKRNL